LGQAAGVDASRPESQPSPQGFAFDAHGQAKSAHLQVGHGAVQHLAHQVSGLLTRQRACAFAPAADFLDVAGNTHGQIVGQA